MSSYPVSFSVPRPDRLERFQVLIRLLAMVLLGMLGLSMGWPMLLLLLILPGWAAVESSTKGGQRYLADDGPRVASAIRWLMAAYAWLGLLTDRLPDARYAENVNLGVEPQGNPVPSSALWRLVRVIPGLVFLMIAGMVGAIIWVVAMVLVAINGTYPASFFHYQEGLLRYTARLLVWHASLVDVSPPFALHDESEHHGDDLAQPRPA